MSGDAVRDPGGERRREPLPAALDTVVVGASAGGVEALRTLVAGLPADFPAAVLVVLHVPQDAPSALAAILDRAGPLPARTAVHGSPLQPGTVIVAAAGHHLLVRDGRTVLSRGPTENGHRPAVDALFRSAAVSRGRHTVAVVLSGTLDDGTAGLAAVRSRGGLAVVQDPADAVYPGMPRHALDAAGADHVLPVSAIPALLDHVVRLRRTGATTGSTRGAGGPLPGGPDDTLSQEAGMAELDPRSLHDPERPGEPAGYSCPDCGGTLFRVEAGEVLRYRCRVGHAWSAGSLAAQQAATHETALWTALRSLEERAALNSELAVRAGDGGHVLSAGHFAAVAQQATRAAELVRELIAEPVATPAPGPEQPEGPGAARGDAPGDRAAG